MPPKLKTPAPIDRPLSRAYLRQFVGWSCAYPPGQSEPNSLRLMENMFVDRNGALSIRPGLRYLSYTRSPGVDPENPIPGLALGLPVVGGTEPFYTNQGEKALLFAVREAADSRIGWRALLFSGTDAVVHNLTDEEIGFSIPQGVNTLNFGAGTEHVEYLQIDNKIIALSDKGEELRMFFVGPEKIAKRIKSISMPRWEDAHKLKVVHPDAAWIANLTKTYRRNVVYNPSFEAGTEFWTKGALTSWKIITSGPNSGRNRVSLSSLPSRTNLAVSPLHNVASTGTANWRVDPGVATISKDGSWMKVYDAKTAGRFWSWGPKNPGVVAGAKYRVAFDYEIGTHVTPQVAMLFYNSAGTKVGSTVWFSAPKKNGRYVSPAQAVPAGTVSIRISLGGNNEAKTSTFVRFKNLMLVKDGESTAMFHGGSGTNYFWAGTVNASASVYHPPVDVTLTSQRSYVHGGAPLYAAITLTTSAAQSIVLRLRTYNKDVVEVGGWETTTTAQPHLGIRPVISQAAPPVEGVTADMRLTAKAVARGQVVNCDVAMIEYGTDTAGIYFDGSTPPTTLTTNTWGDRSKPHRSISVQTVKTNVSTIPVAETPTAKTLIAAGGAANNKFKVGFFYTFENEVGESAPSKITEVRTSRPWSDWNWEQPNSLGEPDPTKPTDVAELCADQLVCVIPQAVFTQAVNEGAIKWNLYAFNWSDQDPVPVTAELIETVDMYPDDAMTAGTFAVSYNDYGWVAVTPQRKAGNVTVPLPTLDNRENYSRPPLARNGLVAGDRVILVGDKEQLATIRWSSNQAGHYTNFTASRTGGTKTLTSGNLNIPGSVVLWQNPQSVDTLTILCLSGDGQSVSYYMTPATTTAQTAVTAIMGFEETTSTPGTTAPFGAEVLNNALYRPTDRALLKSTAQNYNINHKTQSDKIANVWWRLQDKDWIMSAKLDNRLYYLVHNPQGETLAPHCHGNEIWVFDVSGGESGHWSRMLIQASAMRVFSLGDREYLSISHPHGIFYLDPDYTDDDYMVEDQLDPEFLQVLRRPISWRFETNTQGANKAHDAWAHLQMVQLTLGDFYGTMRYGIKGQDVNHQKIVCEKQFTDLNTPLADGQTWDVDDIMQVRRDLKEWVLYGSSVPGLHSQGRIGLAQYRYTPVSVNVGYEYGSLETFEYGVNITDGATVHSDNGIPVPVIDYSKP